MAPAAGEMVELEDDEEDEAEDLSMCALIMINARHFSRPEQRSRDERAPASQQLPPVALGPRQARLRPARPNNFEPIPWN